MYQSSYIFFILFLVLLITPCSSSALKLPVFTPFDSFEILKQAKLNLRHRLLQNASSTVDNLPPDHNLPRPTYIPTSIPDNGGGNSNGNPQSGGSSGSDEGNSNTSSNQGSSSPGISSAVIGGILTIGVLLILIGACVVCCCCLCKRRNKLVPVDSDDVESVAVGGEGAEEDDGIGEIVVRQQRRQQYPIHTYPRRDQRRSSRNRETITQSPSTSIPLTAPPRPQPPAVIELVHPQSLQEPTYRLAIASARSTSSNLSTVSMPTPATVSILRPAARTILLPPIAADVEVISIIPWDEAQYPTVMPHATVIGSGKY